MTNVVVHPRLAAASAKVLARRIESHRGIGIAGLQEAIKNLTRIANEPGYGFARQSVEECESVLSELEALDPAVPPPVENVHALGRRLKRLVDEFCSRERPELEPLDDHLVARHHAEDRNQKSEVRSQKTEVRRQKTEVRSQKTEGRVLSF